MNNKISFILIFLLYSLAYSEIPQEVLSTVFEQHVLQLHNTHLEHKPFMITFSGVPGMGKSKLARELQDTYQAVLISTDALRALFNNAGIKAKEYDEALQHYFVYFFKHYNQPNKRMILDASIDRKYVQLFPFFQQQNIGFVVVRLEVPQNIIIERIIAREGDKAPAYLKHMDKWVMDYNNFGQQYKDSISYAHHGEAKLKDLTDKIDKVLE